MEISEITAKADLLDMAINGSDLSAICNYIAGVIGNPVALTLPTRTIIAHSEDYSSDIVDDYINSGHLMTDEEYSDLYERFQKSFSTGKAGIFIWDFSHFKHLNCGCLFRGGFVAVLDSPLVNAIPNESQIKIFELAAQFMVILMKERKLLNASETEPIQEFLRALVQDRINFAFQWTFRKNFILNYASSFQIVWMAPADSGKARDLAGKIYDFCSARRNWWCIQDDGGYVILIDIVQNSYLHLLADTFKNDFSICVSDQFTDIRDIKDNLNLCRMALKFYSSSMGIGNLVFVDDFKPLIAYFYAYANSGLNIFHNNTVEKIREYDSKFGTSYLETLRVTIHYNQDVEKIAEVLRIHKNTVFYRFRQLKDLFNVDLKDIRQLVNYYMALFIEFHKNVRHSTPHS